jgi:hypothetical protein
VKILRGGRNWFLTGIAARQKPAACQVAPESLQDAEVDVPDSWVCAVAPDELDELQKEALVPRERRLAPTLIAKLLQICPCEVL